MAMDEYREGAFDSLADDEASNVPKESFRIPDKLWNKHSKCEEEKSTILSFEYDISNQCFKFNGKQDVKSLFFEMVQEEHQQNGTSGNRGLAQFLVIRFSERKEDELILTRDKTVESLLRNGVTFSGNTYNIVGCSNSQVQKKSFIFMEGSRKKCDELLKEFLPSIDKLERKKGVAKRVKYAGLLFTGCQYIVKLPKTFRIQRARDRKDEKEKFNFTDGCGLISLKLAREIVKENPELDKKWKNRIPSVWQIRYYGDGFLCKGVVIVDRRNTESSVLTLRKSLIKVDKIGKYFKVKRLGIVDTSLKSKIGKLNKQVVTLLSASVDKEVLLAMQVNFSNAVAQTRFDVMEAVKSEAVMYQRPIHKNLLRKHALDGIISKNYISLVNGIEGKFLKTWEQGEVNMDDIKDRIQIPLGDSRLLFGAAFPEVLHQELQEGECIVCTENGLHLGPVIVNRSPSYSPGDIRVLQAVAPRNSNSIVYEMQNVILFATQGCRPDPDKMSGGDLDGDMYLVIWNAELLRFAEKIKSQKPMDFTHEPLTPTQQKSAKENWLSYVAKWENSMLAQIDSCFYYLAEEYGVNSDECKELCQLFSRAVDQVSSDVKRLKELSSKCSVPKKYKSYIHTPRDDKPVWEQIRENIIDTLNNLNGLDKCPTFEEWSRFYKSLVHVDANDIDEVLQSPDITGCISEEEIDQVREYWKRICKGRVVEPEEIPEPPDCTYDCDIKDCKKRHSKKGSVYIVKWREKLHAEIMDVIQETKDNKVRKESKIRTHEVLRKEMVKLNSEAEREFQEKLKTLERRKYPIYLVNISLSNISETNYRLELERSKIKDPTFWDKIATRVLTFFGLYKGLSPEERSIVKEVSRYKKELVELYNQISKEVNDMCSQFHMAGMLHVKWDTVPDSSHGKRIKKDIKNRINEVLRHKSLTYPEPDNPLSCVENVDLIINIKKADEERLRVELSKNYGKVERQEERILEVRRQKIKITKEIAAMNNDQEWLKNIKDACMESFTNFEQGRPQENEKIIEALRKEKYLGNDSKSLSMLTVLCENNEVFKIREALSTFIPQMVERRLQSLQKAVHQKKKNEMVNVCCEELKEKQILRSLQDETARLNRLISDKQEEIQKYEQMRTTVYDESRHDTAIEEYQILDTGRVEGFDLALNALDHEVEARFNVKEVSEKDRISATIELELCLQREKKRCQRELSEHNLPVFCKRAEILERLKEHDAVIVVAHTGSGKSTQVPQYLADDLHHALSIDNKFPTIACTQPRRVACIRIAERVSLEYAGAVDLPVTKKNNTINDAKTLLGRKRVSAYPLYAKLSAADQDRALDSDDRVGFDEWYEKEETEDENDGYQPNSKNQDLTGTPGEVGQWVGFHIGSKGKSFEERKKSKRHCKDTRIHFVTEGLLLQKLKNASNDTNYKCIIIDEAHERGKDTDLLLAHLNEFLKTKKTKAYKGNNLKIVVMSASINKEAFSAYFGGCPIVECEGKMHEVSIDYMPPPLPNGNGGKSQSSDDSDVLSGDPDYDSSWETQPGTNNNNPSESATTKDKIDDVQTLPPPKKQMNILVEHAVDVIFNKVLTDDEPGDVLVFLPGQGEIHSCVDLINKRAEEELNTLNSGKTNCFQTIKVVCCTNIAETSLTIPGVKFVLDAGKAKKIRYDHKLRVSALKLTNISQASAKQRKGRAGRVQPGKCFRLFSQEHHDTKMEKFDEPEMKQTPIDELYLYALDVFTGLENIELMEDARPEKESIQNAKKRLLNLEYIDKQLQEMVITNDGKFALSLSGDVSLEGSKMILESEKYGITNDALELAVVLEEPIYTSRELNEERMKYNDELGDHLTVFNIYKHFMNKMNDTKLGSKERRKQITRNWCEKLCLNFGTLEQFPKSIDRVYQLMKKEKRIPDKKAAGPSRQRKRTERRNRRGKEDKISSLLENRENLMKILVRGYFHNIAVLNDPLYVKSGYSLVTPANYGDSEVNELEKVELLKLMLSKESTLMQLGDVTSNATAIFRTLFEPADGLIIMKTCSKIRPEWIKECASDRWSRSIGLEIHNDEIINSYVERHSTMYIGPSVLGRFMKIQTEIADSSNEGKQKLVKYLRALELETNAKIRLLFETGEVKIYGSKKEVRSVTKILLPKINGIKSEVFGEDIFKKYPEPEGNNQEMCTIETGLVIQDIKRLPRPEIVTNWDQSSTLLFHQDVTKSQIQNALQRLRLYYLSWEQKQAWDKEEPRIEAIGKQNNLFKVQFQRQDIAIKMEETLRGKMSQFSFSRTTKCFFDKQIQFRVIKTSLYPCVHEIAQDFPYLDVTEPGDRGELFRVKPVKKPPRSIDTQEQIDSFILRLREEGIFGSELIEDLSTKVQFGVREFIHWKITQLIKENNWEAAYNIQIRSRRKPVFEVFGEQQVRKSVAKQIRVEIARLQFDIERNVNKYTKTYNKRIQLSSRDMLGPVVYKINELRADHNNLQISIVFDGAGGNKALPIVHVLCDNAEDGRSAFEDIVACYQTTATGRSGGDNPVCCMCRLDVFLPKSAKQKTREMKELKKARELKGMSGHEGKIRINTDNEDKLPVAQRLMICGCTYCKKCFEKMVQEQLTEQTASARHKSIECIICKQTVLMKDISRLWDGVKNRLYEKTFKNFLLARQSGRGGKVDQCGQCYSIFVVEPNDKGMYRCPNEKCRFLFCCGCGKRIINHIDFQNHVTCRRR